LIRITHLQLKPRNRGRRIVATIQPPGKSAAQFHIIAALDSRDRCTLNAEALGLYRQGLRDVGPRTELVDSACSYSSPSKYVCPSSSIPLVTSIDRAIIGIAHRMQ
jgi:hypothetical protein